MNILILTGRFGMGHCVVAEAVREQLLEKAPDAQISVVDVIDWVCPQCGQRIYGSFNFTVRHAPHLFNVINTLTDHELRVPLRSVMLRKLSLLWQQYSPDLVISTLPVCARYVSAYKEETGIATPLYTYVTDVTLHEDWIAPHTDLYFVGAQSTKDALIARGVPAGRVVVSGIPVRTCFQGAARRRESGEKAELLIMGGGLGLIPGHVSFLSQLSGSGRVHITVITGGNHTLWRQLRLRFPEIEAVGWTSEVQKYLRRADLLVTKAGGSSLFEAIETQTPLYILRPFLAQEMGNANYIECCGIGRVRRSRLGDPAAEILSLLDDPGQLAAMGENMARLRSARSSGNALLYYTYGAVV